MNAGVYPSIIHDNVREHGAAVGLAARQHSQGADTHVTTTVSMIGSLKLHADLTLEVDLTSS